MSEQRLTSTATQLLRADCQRCRWSCTSANAQGIAAQHHDRTGHPVVVTKHQTVTYGDLHAAAPGQTSMEVAA